MPMPNDLVETQLIAASAAPERVVWIADIRNVLLSAWCGEQHRHPDYYKALIKVALAFGINVDAAPDPTPWRVESGYNALEVIERDTP